MQSKNKKKGRPTKAKAKATSERKPATRAKANAKPGKVLKQDYHNIYSRVYHAGQRKGLTKTESAKLARSAASKAVAGA